MIIDHLNNYSEDGIQNIRNTIRYFLNSIPDYLSDGRYVLEENRLIAIVSTYQTKPDTRWESHRSFIDIQYIISGREKISFALPTQLRIVRPYDPVDDCVFYEGDGNSMELCEGMFAVFHPLDAHRPGLSISSPGLVKKLIFKVAVEYWGRLPEKAFYEKPESIGLAI